MCTIVNGVKCAFENGKCAVMTTVVFKMYILYCYINGYLFYHIINDNYQPQAFGKVGTLYSRYLIVGITFYPKNK